MSTQHSKGASETEVLLTQYEQAWQQIEHYDSSYIQISLLYIALMGAYIGVFDKTKVNPVLIACCLVLISACVIGAIWRLRKLVDQQMEIVAAIAKVTGMQKGPSIGGIGSIRTSTHLIVIIIAMTVLAIVLGLTRQPLVAP